MQQERDNGARLTVGTSWVVGWEEWISRDGWKDMRDSRQELRIIRGDITRGEQVVCRKEDLETFCNQIPVAWVSEILFDHGVKAFQLIVSPQISSIEINPLVEQKVKQWVFGASEGEGLCGEIKEYCDQRGMTKEQQAAISFLVYVRRKGANRWG